MILPARLPAAGQSPCPRPPASRRPVPLPAPACQPPASPPALRRPAGPPASLRRVSLVAPWPPPPPAPPRSALRAPRGVGRPESWGGVQQTPLGRPLPRLPFVARQGVPCLGFPLLSASRWRAAPPPLRVARAPSRAVKALRASLRSALRPAPRSALRGLAALTARQPALLGRWEGRRKMAARWG